LKSLYRVTDLPSQTVENDHAKAVDRDCGSRNVDRRRAGVLGLAVLRPRVAVLLSGFAVLRPGLLQRIVLRPEMTAVDMT
jgi:hypothetical protein